jgi:hypothetical protein
MDCIVRKVQENQESLKFDGTYQLLVYGNNAYTMGTCSHPITKNTEAL